MEIGTTFAVCRYSDVWAYRVVGETPKRWNVEVIKKPDSRWASGPHSGRGPCYFDKGARDLVAYVGDEQLAAIAAAWVARSEAEGDAKDAHRVYMAAIKADYEAALDRIKGTE